MPRKPPPYMTVIAAAAYLGVAQQTVYNMLRDDRLVAAPNVVEGGGQLVTRASVEAQAAKRKGGAK